MQVILIQDVDHLGGRNELVTVKNGYARNYLIPSKFAIEASPSNLKQLEEKIFGSVTSLQISRAIRDQKGYEIDRKKISIVDEVKELGTYKATVEFGNGHSTELEFEVIAE